MRKPVSPLAINHEPSTIPKESLRAIATGFSLLGYDDFKLMELEFPMYDALYAWCKSRAGG